MRLLFVVQRFGVGIAGGAEYLVREYCRRLAARGHDVEVLTSCAESYIDWANVLEPGTEVDGGVQVHRLAVTAARDNTRFGPFHQRMLRTRDRGHRVSVAASEQWARAIGPDLDGYLEWLSMNAGRFDAVVFSGYLYTPSMIGLRHVAATVPTLLQCVAHDETPLRLPVMREMFDHAAAINFLTDEERDLVLNRFDPPGLACDRSRGRPGPRRPANRCP